MANTQSLRLRFDAFDLDEAEARLTRDGRQVALPPKAFAVLCTLARQPGQLVTKDALLDAVWGHRHVSESVLKSTISEMRAALSDDARQPRYIETVSRRGYRFIGTTGVAAAPAAGLADPPPVPNMVGRQAALNQLRSAWNRAAAGQRQVFWVAGEAGVGKTTLLDGFVAGLGPVVCARGQCVEQYGAGEPYLPVLEALGMLCRSDPSLPELMRSIAPTWLFQLPWLIAEADRAALRHELAGAGQDRMLRELAELLDQYTRKQPLLLVTEDLHWSDHATLRLIDHVARRRSPARLMWLGSFRLADIIAEDHPLKDLRHELRMHKLCDEVVLDSFSELEVADYMVRRFPATRFAEDFVRALHARTDGLPLFVANVVDDLVSQGTIGPGQSSLPGEGGMAGEVPENLAGVIGRQIARLPPESRAMLEAASVCGMEFRPDTVAATMERDVGWVRGQCDELVRRQHWLHPLPVTRTADGSLDARFTFHHALYRQVLYQQIGALARAELHRRVAQALGALRTSGAAVAAAELASHYELSHDLPLALRHYAEAAESALRHFAPTEATALITRALELLKQLPAGLPRDVLELTLSAMRGVSAAQLRGVSSLDAKQAFERARALLENLPQHPMRSMVLHASGLVLLVRGEYAEARALGEHVLALSQLHGDRILLLSACSVLGQVHALQGRPRQSRELLDQGARVCSEIGDATLQAAFVVDPGVTMYAARAIALLHLGLADQARASIEAAHERANRLGQPMAKMVAHWFNGLLEVRLGNPARVAELADRLRRIVEDGALAQGEAPSRWFRGWADAHLADPRAAHQAIRAAYEHNSRLGMFSGASEVLRYAAEALALAGEWAAARSQLDEAIELVHRFDERVSLTQMLVQRGRIALACGDPAAARESMQAALQEARTQESLWLELVAVVALCELDGATAGDRNQLAQVCARVTEGFDTPLVSRARALLARA